MTSLFDLIEKSTALRGAFGVCGSFVFNMSDTDRRQATAGQTFNPRIAAVQKPGRSTEQGKL